MHNRIQDANKGLVSPCSPEDEAAGKCFGGYGRLSTMGRSLRQKAARAGATFYLLNAGDEFLGTLWDVVGAERGVREREGRGCKGREVLGGRAALCQQAA